MKKASKTRALFFISAALALILGGCGSTSDRGHGSANINWREFDEGFAEASASAKPMMVVYETSWCTWCKKLKNTTLADPKITGILNESFVVISIDGGSSQKLNYNGTELTEREFARTMQVQGYPTTIFFDSEGELIYKYTGYYDSSELKVLLSYIDEGAYKTEKFDTFMHRYKKG